MMAGMTFCYLPDAFFQDYRHCQYPWLKFRLTTLPVHP
jgi:hypothetical protein